MIDNGEASRLLMCWTTHSNLGNMALACPGLMLDRFHAHIYP